MSLLSLLLPLLAQVGPMPSESPISAVPPELRDRPPRERSDIRPSGPNAWLSECSQLALDEPQAALERAQSWFGRSDGLAKAHAAHCEGLALVNLGQLDRAASTFLVARNYVPPENSRYRARLGAMSGNAVLGTGHAEFALDVLEQAANELGDEPSALAGGISRDRARALVMVGDIAGAQEQLADARRFDPGNAEGWLLSATLSRRLGQLAEAQAQIEQAALRDTQNPSVGLEAGVIAVLAGQDDAARASWQSVIDTAPETPQAEQAQAYLAQLGEP